MRKKFTSSIVFALTTVLTVSSIPTTACFATSNESPDQYVVYIAGEGSETVVRADILTINGDFITQTEADVTVGNLNVNGSIETDPCIKWCI